MDRTRAEKLHRELNDLLQDFAKRHGLSAGPVRLSYTGRDVVLGKMMFGDKTVVNSTVDPKYVRNLAIYGSWYGLKVEDVGKMYVSNGRPVKLEGMKNKTAVLFSNSDGKLLYADGLAFAQANALNVIDPNLGVAFPGFKNRHED